MKVKVSVVQSCLTFTILWSAHAILQTRILEWVAIPFSRRSSWPILHGRVQMLCQNVTSRIISLKNIYWLSKHLVYVRHWVQCWDTGVSKVDKVPPLMKLPGCLKVIKARSGKRIPGRGNNMGQGPEVGRDLPYFINRKTVSSDDDWGVLSEYGGERQWLPFRRKMDS